MTNVLRPAQVWAIYSPDHDRPYYAMVVCRDSLGPRRYAPDDKRSIGLHADALSAFTFHPDGLLCEGTTSAELAEYVKSHQEVFATREQLDAYYARGNQYASL